MEPNNGIYMNKQTPVQRGISIDVLIKIKNSFK